MGDFIREKIKDKPLNKKKVLTRLGLSVLSGFLFGVTACGVLFAYSLLHGDEDDSSDRISQNQGTENPADTEINDTESNDNPVVSYDFTIGDYQKVQSQLYSIGIEAGKSIVTITSVVGGTDLFNNSYETEGIGLGIIVKDTGSQLMIATDKLNVQDAESLSVTFCNEYTAEAIPVKYDGNTGIAVISVDKSQLDDSTTGAISLAAIGTSTSCSRGQTVIALEPNDTIYTGSITSTVNEISGKDNNYSVLTTDIYSGNSNEGVLINTNGEVIGFVVASLENSENRNLAAVGISELWPVVDELCSGNGIPYTGIYCTTVTDKISNRYNIPKGVYVKDVEMDSPAFAAGIQSGDVITKLNGEKVLSVSGYNKQLMSLSAGQKVDVVIKRKGSNGYTDITCQVEIGELN